MAYIVENLSTRRIQLGFEQFTRKMAIGTNWNKIRIGFRACINDLGTSFPGTLVVGVMQGADYLYRPDVIDFVGVSYPNSPPVFSQIWTRTQANGPSYTHGQYYVKRKIKAVWTTAGGVGTSHVISANPAMLSSVFVDIEKTTTAYSLTPIGSLSTTIADTPRSTFITQLECESTPLSLNIVGATTLNYSGPNGLYDTVCIHWDRAVPTLEITDVCVIRFY
jgi:hypothetical protein